jgi:hypothetical protein
VRQTRDVRHSRHIQTFVSHRDRDKRIQRAAFAHRLEIFDVARRLRRVVAGGNRSANAAFIKVIDVFLGVFDVGRHDQQLGARMSRAIGRPVRRAVVQRCTANCVLRAV